eukprot:TRINITY_DN6749_c0_g1_i2.p1 TRINITY_DN6749_c0_g1~~TRINITY_DN6749_c0_g1_i2.p1  ORF type:complete len:679 (+),score=35.37 TRINITY_DN6749_c0_g1_i2:557-2593(+)
MSFWTKSIAKQLSLNSTVSKNSKSKKSDQKEEEDIVSMISSSASKSYLAQKSAKEQDKLHVPGKERRRSNTSGGTARISNNVYMARPSLDGVDSLRSSKSRELAQSTKVTKDAKPVPVSAAHVLMHHRDCLTDAEQSEVLQYQNIYYWGQNCKREKKIRSDPKLPHNFGYDDNRADLIAVKSDHLAYRYEVLEVLGRGSFGQVLRCYDHKSKTMRAVKVIRNRRRFKHQAAQEIRMLDKLATKGEITDTNNLVKKLGHFMFRGHLCISFELLSLNLYEVLRKEGFRGLAPGLVRKICTQVLECLSYLKQSNVIHCDLKPENILLKSASKPGSVKVVDFGSSCFEDERVYTYIQSRFYRAPEVILGLPYSGKIDMWSLGCVLAELHNGFPLFPGENEPEQLLCIMEVLGLPPDYVIEASPRRKLFFDSANHPRIVPGQRGRRRIPNSKSLDEVVKGADPLFIDFLRKCLKWDAHQRMTPQEALTHPWLSQPRSGAGFAYRSTPAAAHPPHYPGHMHTTSIYDMRKQAMQSSGAGYMQRVNSEDIVRARHHPSGSRGEREGDGVARTLARQPSNAYGNTNTALLSARSLKGSNASLAGSQGSTGSQQRMYSQMNALREPRQPITPRESKLVRNFSLAPRSSALTHSPSTDIGRGSANGTAARNESKKNFFPLLFQRHSKH